MELVDKSVVGVGGKQYHVGIAPGEVGTVALLPGDPFRVPLIAEFLTDARLVAHQREHMTMVGYYENKLITATSTGMGCPSTAIAVEELARCGVTSFIRVGSSAGLQPGVEPGDLLVSHGSLRTGASTPPTTPSTPRPPSSSRSSPASACSTSRWRARRCTSSRADAACARP
jgi:uridine phosphorylase